MNVGEKIVVLLQLIVMQSVSDINMFAQEFQAQLRVRVVANGVTLTAPIRFVCSSGDLAKFNGSAQRKMLATRRQARRGNFHIDHK